MVPHLLYISNSAFHLPFAFGTFALSRMRVSARSLSGKRLLKWSWIKTCLNGAHATIATLRNFLFAFFHTFSCYFIYLVLFLYLFLSYRSESLLSSLQIVFYHFILYAKTLLYAIRFSSWQKEANEANEKRQSKKDRDL